MRTLLTRLVALSLALTALSLSVGAPAAQAAPVFDRGTLFFIQTRGTASGFVEIHTASAQSHYRSADLHTTTYFRPAEAAQGFFQMLGSDLYFIKVCQTGSGQWEMHSATGASGYRSGLHEVINGVPAASTNCPAALAAVSSLGIPKLDPSLTTRPVLSYPARLSSGAFVEYWGIDFPSYTRLPFLGGRILSDGVNPIVLHPTGTGTAAVDASGFAFNQSVPPEPPATAPSLWARRTAFRAGDLASGVADARDVTGDPHTDLTLVKLYGTGSGRIEVFADAAGFRGAGVGTLDLASATWFPGSLASYGTWQLGSSNGAGQS